MEIDDTPLFPDPRVENLRIKQECQQRNLYRKITAKSTSRLNDKARLVHEKITEKGIKNPAIGPFIS
jgi:hypothetical protein